MARKNSSVVLSPGLLKEYSSISPRLPASVIDKINNDQRWEFVYALCTAFMGWSLAGSALAGFVFLIMHGHDTSAYTLLGANVLGFVTAFVRARLRIKDPKE